MITVTRTVARPTVLPVVRSGAIAAAAGAAALLVYGTIADALGVPMHAGDPGASAAQPITPANFAGGTVFCTFFGTLLAIVLARRAAVPAKTFVRVSAVLVAVSLVFPLAASHTAESTRLVLAAGHLLAAMIIVPILARRLAR